jgi:predicted metal-dependent phosphotriesterase family hydrolase
MVKRREFIVGGGTVIGASALATDQAVSYQQMAMRDVADQSDLKVVTATGESRKPTKSDVLNASYIDPRLDSRSASFENPTGARGSFISSSQARGLCWQI